MPIAPPVRRLDSNHDITGGAGLANYATGSEATAQRVRTTLLWVLGEWWLDATGGVPWFSPEEPSDPDYTGVAPIIGGSGAPNLGYNETVLKAAILGVVGVATLDSFAMTLDHLTRVLSVDASGTDVDGGVWTVAFQDPGP
jgi:hypothetical protein